MGRHHKAVGEWMDGWRLEKRFVGVFANVKRLEGTGFVCGRLEDSMVIEWQLLG
jgi:hypothetical protein